MSASVYTRPRAGRGFTSLDYAAKDPRFYLLHIHTGAHHECCERILNYMRNLGTEWPGSPLVVDAVCRNLESIGEAASKLDAEFRQLRGEVPWRSIINARNLLIHAYDRVNPAVLGNVVERDIPEWARADAAPGVNGGMPAAYQMRRELRPSLISPLTSSKPLSSCARPYRLKPVPTWRAAEYPR